MSFKHINKIGSKFKIMTME